MVYDATAFYISDAIGYTAHPRLSKFVVARFLQGVDFVFDTAV